MNLRDHIVCSMISHIEESGQGAIQLYNVGAWAREQFFGAFEEEEMNFLDARQLYELQQAGANLKWAWVAGFDDMTPGEKEYLAGSLRGGLIVSMEPYRWGTQVDGSYTVADLVRSHGYAEEETLSQRVWTREGHTLGVVYRIMDEGYETVDERMNLAGMDFSDTLGFVLAPAGHHPESIFDVSEEQGYDYVEHLADRDTLLDRFYAVLET